MMSLFQDNHVIRFDDQQHNDVLKWCRIFDIITKQCQLSVLLSGQMDAGLSL